MPNVFAASGDISITFHDKELHDDTTPTDDYTLSTFAGAGYDDASVNALNSSAVLRFDGNADGDLKDSTDDYDLYTHIVVIDQTNGDIQFAYNLTENATYSNADGSINAGEVVTIKGDSYVVKDNETADQNIQLGPAIARTLTATTVDKDSATMISGTKKMLYGNDGYLYFYDAGSHVESAISNTTWGSNVPYKLTSSQITSDEFKPYNIYVVSSDASEARVTLVEKDQIVKLTNNEEGVIGYASVKIGDTDWFSGGTSGVYFLSDTIALVKGDTIDLPDTYYSLKYTAAKQFDIRRKKTSTVLSGTELKDTTAPGEDFLADGASITMSVVSGDIKIEFNSQELHDDSAAQDDYTVSTFADTGYTNASVNALDTSAVLRFDGNADGDLKDDPDDYDLYNHIVMIDTNSGNIQLAYNLSEHGTYANGDGNINAGDVITIKGDKYVVTDNKTSDQNIELGPAITKTLTATTVDKDNAITVSGTKKVLYGSDGGLYFYDGGSITDGPINMTALSQFPHKLTSTQIESDEFKPYKIYILSSTSSTTKITMVEKDQIVKLSNDEEGVVGYSSIKIADSSWLTGGTEGIFFLSDQISLVENTTIELADTYYSLRYTVDKEFDILRKKTSWVASGTKLKTNIAPGKDFLKESITVTAIIVSPPAATPPTITITSPADGSVLAQNWAFINMTASEPLNTALIEWNGANETMSGLSLDWYVNKTGLTGGIHTYRVWASDIAGNWNVSETRTVTVITTAEVTQIADKLLYELENGSCMEIQILGSVLDRAIFGICKKDGQLSATAGSLSSKDLVVNIRPNAFYDILNSEDPFNTAKVQFYDNDNIAVYGSDGITPIWETSLSDIIGLISKGFKRIYENIIKIELSADSTSKSGDKEVTYGLTLRNTQNISDTFTLNASNADNANVHLSLETISLGQNASSNLTLGVSGESGGSYIVAAYAISQNDARIVGAAYTATTINTASVSSGRDGGGGDTGTDKAYAIVQMIEAKRPASFAFSEAKSEFISEIVLTAKQARYNMKITVETLTGKPYSSMPDPKGVAYKYLKITASNIPATAIDKADIKFKVEGAWLKENDINPATVSLNRNVQNRWDVLPTRKTGRDDTYVHYTAETPGFSHFAITAEDGSGYVEEAISVAAQVPTIAPLTTTLASTTPTPTTPPATPAPAPLPIAKALLLLIAAIAAGAYLFLRKRNA